MFTRYVLPLIGAVTLLFAVTQILKAQQKPDPVDPPIDPGKSPYVKQLAGSGIVEPETENILVGTHVAGIVDKLYVKVGDVVKPGAPLFQIDDRSLQAELKVRRALLASAKAQLGKLNMPPRPEERPGFEAKVAEVATQVKDAQQLYERIKRLGPSASEEELVRRELAVELAKSQLDKAKADLKLWEAGTWQPDKDISAALVAEAQSRVEQTEIELSRLTARAPHSKWTKGSEGREIPADGDTEYQVLQVNIRPGESVGMAIGTTQALIVLGYVGKLHVRVDFDENDIVRFRTDLPGVAKPRGNPNVSLPLKFVRVDPYVIPKRSLTGANTERVDTRVLQVLYSLEGNGHSLYVGQQMDVILDAGAKAGK